MTNRKELVGDKYIRVTGKDGKEYLVYPKENKKPAQSELRDACDSRGLAGNKTNVS